MQTFAVVQVHIHRLVRTESTESYHVLMGMEGDAIQRSAVTKLWVHSKLISWESSKIKISLMNNGLSSQEPYVFFCLFVFSMDCYLCRYSRHTPSHPRFQRRWNSHRVWKCYKFSLCSLLHQCTSSQPSLKRPVWYRKLSGSTPRYV